MATQTQLAAFALNAYELSGVNQIDVGQFGWNLDEERNEPSGFAASVFTGPGNEVVIAFRGTDNEPPLNIDWATGNTAALGIHSEQVRQAIETVADVMAAHPGATITLTGHSLGAGLASLMAVYFDLNATVFAAAPFEASARSDVLQQYFDEYVTYQFAQGRGIAINQAFQSYVENASGLFAQRELNVIERHINNEILDFIRTPGNTVVGEIGEIDIGATTLNEHAALIAVLLSQPRTAPLALAAIQGLSDAVSLHNMGLHVALVASDELQQASRQLPALLQLMLDERLYAGNIATAVVNFSNRLLNDHLSGDGSSLLRSFAQDMLRLGSSGSTHRAGVRDGLIATTIEHYRFAPTNSTSSFLQTSGNGVVMDLSQIDSSSDGKGRRLLLGGLAELLDPLSRARVMAAASGASVWTVQAGANGLTTSGRDESEVQIGGENQSNLLVGGAGADVLINGNSGGRLEGGDQNDILLGGNAADLLYGDDGDDHLRGGAGNDTLSGGEGRDELYGGEGNDTYEFFDGDGTDIVLDSDGLGTILYEGEQIAVGDRIAENIWRSEDGALTITRRQVSGANVGLFDLTIRNASSSTVVTIRSWHAGELGLTLEDTPIEPEELPPAPQNFSNTWDGTQQDDQQSGIWQGYVHGAFTRIDSLGGNDRIDFGWSDPNSPNPAPGTTLVRAGEGHDQAFIIAPEVWVYGEAGNDLVSGLGVAVVSGGSGSDLVYAGQFWLGQPDAAGDRLYGDEEIPLADAIAAGETDPGLTVTGDMLSAWTSDDILVGTAARDVLGGGGGSDTLVGGAGNDLILGDTEVILSLSYPGHFWHTFQWDWSTSVVDNGNGTITHSFELTNYIEYSNGQSSTGNWLFGITAEGADTVFAGAGDDYVRGDGGDDFLDGGTGNDVMFGGSGSDILIGGAGNDILEGDEAGDIGGSDFLDGGDDDDHLSGGLGSDTLFGGEGNDLLIGDESDVEAGNDYLNGEGGDDILFGAAGADTLFGGSGNDQLHGDSSATAANLRGDDYLDGGDGDDILVGDGGADTLYGGAGADQLWGDASFTPDEVHGDDFLDGGADNDQLIGGGGSDRLFGGAGDDELQGDSVGLSAALHRDDYLDGGDGNDNLFGLGGNDTLIGGAGNDLLIGDLNDVTTDIAGNDILEGGEGDDQLQGNFGDDSLSGGDGNDTLFGGDGDDHLMGDAGTDVLHGGAGNDVISGGLGVDNMQGGAGDDTYVIQADDFLVINGMREVIQDTEGTNRVIFGSGFALSDLMTGVGASSVDLVIGTTTQERQISIHGALNGAVQSFTFSDGSTLAANQLVGQYYAGNASRSSTAANATLLGGALNDTISGTGENATISGGRGNDTLTGGTSAKTTFLFERGDGADTINDQGNRIVNGQPKTNTLVFGDGIELEDIVLHSNENGVFSIKFTDIASDSIRLQFFTRTDVLNGNRTIDVFRFSDGTTLTWGEIVTQLGIDMVKSGSASTFNGTNVNDRMVGTSANETIDGREGDDVLQGMGGNDTLTGGAGSDTYVFGRGHGIDTINNTDQSASTDRLLFQADVAPGDVKWYRYEDNLIGRITGAASDRVIVTTFFTTGALDLIEFADGTSYTAATLTLANPNDQATSGPDEIFGSIGDDLIDAGAGNDLVFAGRGDDTVFGGSGTDTLRGELGNDFLDGGSENDTLYGGDGDDTLTDSLGTNNLLFGEGGNDTLVGWGTLDGGDGADQLTAAGDFSTLRGGNGDDLLISGAGNDALSGDAGNDIYLYAAGSGEDRILQNDAGAGRLDVLHLTGGIRPEDVVLQSTDTGDVLLRFRLPNGQFDPNNEILLQQFLVSDALTAKLDRIEFEAAPGVVWTWSFIEQLLFTPTNGNDYIRGTSGSDVLDALGGDDTVHGQGGDDILYGIEGSDRLFGGAGNDVLYIDDAGDQAWGDEGNDTLIALRGRGTMRGGAGSDTYVIERAVAATTISDIDTAAASVDVLRFGAGITPDSVTIRRSGNDLVMTVRNLALPDRLIMNEVRIAGYFVASNLNRIIDEVRFTDDPATVLNFATIQALTLISNDTGETLTGFSGNDTIVGNGGDDSLSGLDGNDDLNGGPGADTLLGGAGNDVYRFARGDGNDTITDSAGTDRIELAAGITAADVTLYRTSGTPGDALIVVIDQGNQQIRINNHYAAGDASRVEEIRFADGTIWGVAQIAANVINVTGTANSHAGTAANNTFTVDHPSDTITEAANGGTDTVNASVSFTLPNNVENLNLTGPLNIDGTGNALANVIVGNAGDNRLVGNGGADTLIGGGGDDTYLVDQLITGYDQASFQDQVIEDAAGGIDTIIADTYSAVLPENVERLILRTALHPTSFPLGTFWRRFIGNSADNYIDVSGPNSIGWARTVYVDGGAGADTMIGRQGANIYVVDNPGDVVIELAGDGQRNAVWSYLDYTLVTHTYIHDLKLLGSNATMGIGNGLNNVLDGQENAASNELRGLAGDDVYIVDASDVVIETAGGGVDRVECNTSYTLPDHVENLTLTGSGTGIGNALDNVIMATAFFTSNTLFGEDGNDRLLGGSGDDTLWGGAGDDWLEGGPGADSMHGGTGNDTYVVEGESFGVFELEQEGIDTVLTSTSFLISPNVENLTLTGTAAVNGTGNALNNIIIGNAGANVLAGGGGDDTLVGANGADTYVFSAGDGADTIDNASVDTALDILEFTDLARADVAFTQVGDDLLLSRSGTGDSVRVAGWFADVNSRVDSVQFTDEVLSADDIDALFGAGLQTSAAQQIIDLADITEMPIAARGGIIAGLETLYPRSVPTEFADLRALSNADASAMPVRRNGTAETLAVTPADAWTTTMQRLAEHLAQYEADVFGGMLTSGNATTILPWHAPDTWSMRQPLRVGSVPDVLFKEVCRLEAL